MKTFLASVVLLILPCFLAQGPPPTKLFLQWSQNTTWTHIPSRQANGTSCNQPPDYPLARTATAAGVIDGRVTVCGGTWAGNEEVKYCYSLDAGLNLWVEFPEMNVWRYSAASVMTPYGWWITGGNNDDILFMASTSLWDGSFWKAGPRLPSGRELHCMAQVNSTHTFVAGGLVNGVIQPDAYLYDWEADEWTSLPDVRPRTYGTACTHYEDGQGGSFILMAGGWTSNRIARSLDLNNPSEWQFLPQLPTPAFWGVFFRDGRDLLVANPMSTNILRFNESDWTFSVVEGESMADTGTSSAAILAISDDSLNGCA